MSGSAPQNSQAVDFERQQAAEADAKEAARQQRLQQGQDAIDKIFNGQDVMGPKDYDWSTFQAPQAMPAAMSAYLAQNPGTAAPDFSKTGSVPAGYTAVQVAPRAPAAGAPGAAAPSRYSYGAYSSGPSAGQPIAPATTGAPGAAASSPYSYGTYSSGPNAGQSINPTSGGAGGQSSVWALKDANGKIYYQGDPLTYQAPTGQKTGGFGDDFYKAYNQKVLDYYNPDEQRQYDTAKRDLTYNLARAGTLQSSTAGDKTGELAYNDALQKANIVSNANTQTGNLKNQIQANKESLINQLYATEDPTLTANLAQSSANATRLQDPMLTPAAQLFTPALSAAGSVVNSLSSPYGLYGGGAQSGALTNPVPTPASGTGAGKLSSGGPSYS